MFIDRVLSFAIALTVEGGKTKVNPTNHTHISTAQKYIDRLTVTISIHHALSIVTPLTPLCT